MSNRSRSSDSSQESSCFSGKIVSYSCKVRFMVIVCFLLLASVLALIYFLLAKTTSTQENILALPKKLDWFPQCPSSLLLPSERFNCYPDDSRATKEACEGRGCCYLGPLTYDYNDTIDDNVPTCVYPSNYGYEASNKASVTLDGFEVPLRRIPAPSRYGDDIQTVYMKVEMQTKYRLRIKVRWNLFAYLLLICLRCGCKIHWNVDNFALKKFSFKNNRYLFLAAREYWLLNIR